MNESAPQGKLNVFDFKNPSIKTLHYTWFAFFLTFVLWFSHAPLRDTIREAFNLSKVQWKALIALNVALTIPSRIVIGILVDKYGPRLTFSLLLIAGGIATSIFATSQNYGMLALTRFLMGFIGAGFVIGIRMVGEWFPAKNVGLAEGIYGGWGNFGSAAAALTIPTISLMYGGENGWRYALFSVSLITIIYGVIFYRNARNTPEGSTYFKPKKAGGLEVSNKRDFYFLLAMNIPMYLALAVLTWKISNPAVGLLSSTATYIIYALLLILFVYQTLQIIKVNKEMLQTGGVPEYQRYSFKQVAILDINYFITFGSELAVVSMLPGFFADTFGLPMTKAALLASGFAFMNLAARPGGGWLSDRFGRRLTMIILLVGLAIGYLTLGQINSNWPIALAVLATMGCSFFVQAGEGAVFAMVPLIQRRMTGQIAGMAGAYGNVGAVTFLTVFTFVNASTFFTIIAASSILGFVASYFLEEPKGHVSEVNEDGTVELIEVS